MYHYFFSHQLGRPIILLLYSRTCLFAYRIQAYIPDLHREKTIPTISLLLYFPSLLAYLRKCIEMKSYRAYANRQVRLYFNRFSFVKVFFSLLPIKHFSPPFYCISKTLIGLIRAAEKYSDQNHDETKIWPRNRIGERKLTTTKFSTTKNTSSLRPSVRPSFRPAIDLKNGKTWRAQRYLKLIVFIVRCFILEIRTIAQKKFFLPLGPETERDLGVEKIQKIHFFLFDHK